MCKAKTVAIILAILIFIVGAAAAQTLEDNWNDFLHYTKIGHFDLAKGYGQAILQSDPDPVELLELSWQNQPAFSLLLKVNETAPDEQLTAITGQILDLIENGRYLQRSDSIVIAQEV
ncbi:unnamed protein product, partial [marine sediment metagenome]